jgi:hypothetical protein
MAGEPTQMHAFAPHAPGRSTHETIWPAAHQTMRAYEHAALALRIEAAR